MIRFLGKLLLFSFVLSATYLLLVHKLSQGYVDMYYPKFTQPGGSLVLGLSRADQGIDPSLLREELRPADFAAPFVNFASNQSYYGEVYPEGHSEEGARQCEKRAVYPVRDAGIIYRSQKGGRSGAGQNG